MCFPTSLASSPPKSPNPSIKALTNSSKPIVPRYLKPYSYPGTTGTTHPKMIPALPRPQVIIGGGKFLREDLEETPRASQPHGTYGGGGGGDANFDTNMVIILAALLCALICALGLNSIVRCALRCGRRIAFETPEETAARLAGTGLKKRALRRIPVAVYGPSAGVAETECPICLGEFADGEKVRVLPRCNHGFHVRCIDTWLASHSSCPTCRHSLLDRAADGAASGSTSGPAVESAAVVVDQVS